MATWLYCHLRSPWHTKAYSLSEVSTGYRWRQNRPLSEWNRPLSSTWSVMLGCCCTRKGFLLALSLRAQTVGDRSDYPWVCPQFSLSQLGMQLKTMGTKAHTGTLENYILVFQNHSGVWHYCKSHYKNWETKYYYLVKWPMCRSSCWDVVYGCSMKTEQYHYFTDYCLYAILRLTLLTLWEIVTIVSCMIRTLLACFK